MSHDEAPIIDSQAGFAAALRWGLAQAITGDARRIVFVDPDFSLWPLDDESLLRSLGGWLRLPGRRLILLAADYGEVARCWPRFTIWRRDWVHAIDAWQAPAEVAASLPTLLIDDRAVSVQLIDRTRWRGRATLERRRTLAWQERLTRFCNAPSARLRSTFSDSRANPRSVYNLGLGEGGSFFAQKIFLRRVSGRWHRRP